MQQNKTPVIALCSLFLILFIDGLGQGILYPILAHTLLSTHSAALVSASTSEGARSLLFGLAVGIFYLGWFFGGTFLSDATDKIGRKKGMAACVLGSAIGYVLSALAFVFRSVGLLIIGRTIDGLTAGDQPIAQASIIDSCPEEKRSTFIGLVLLCFTGGLIVGPIVGGFLSDSHLLSWFNNSTPLYLGAVLCVIAFLGLSLFYKDTNTTKRDVKLSIFRPFVIFAEGFRHKTVRYLLVAFAMVQFGWYLFYAYISNFESKVYHFDMHQVALYMSLLGIGLTIGLGVLPRFFRKIKNQQAVASGGYLVLGLGVFSAAFFQNVIVFWALALLVSMAITVGYTAITPLFAKQVAADRIGWVMGLTGSMIALAACLASVSAGFLSQLSYALPLYVGSLALFIGAVIIKLSRLKQ